jgi:pyruvate dehydrogenase (quinone)
MAGACGVRGIRLEDPSEVEEGIATALAHDGPVPVDAVMGRTVLPVPPAIAVEMASSTVLRGCARFPSCQLRGSWSPSPPKPTH